jgi:subtilisin family serine protease
MESLIGPLEVVKLPRLMERTSGRPEIHVALIDGPVALDHPDLARQNVQEVGEKGAGACSASHSVACMHGTFVAGMLSAKRGSAAPAICPGCTLLVRPIFPASVSHNGGMPSAPLEQLAAALIESVNAGVRVINLSAGLAQPSVTGAGALEEALSYAARRDAIVVAAAGNQGTVGSSAITKHPWVIPVTGCDLQGRPTSESNIGHSIGRNGLMAPARDITSLGSDGKPQVSGGTSVAAPFVTGTIALLWSEFPSASASAIKRAIRREEGVPRRTVVPPLLDAWAAYRAMAAMNGRFAA